MSRARDMYQLAVEWTARSLSSPTLRIRAVARITAYRTFIEQPQLIDELRTRSVMKQRCNYALAADAATDRGAENQPSKETA